MKILILGGYGVFGGRLVRLLADLNGLELLICGRNLAAAQAFCDTTPCAPRLRPLRVDRTAIASVLDSERPDLVVDASGPFQDYGDHGYNVIEACIAARIPYLDFADGADFVSGVSRYDAAARAAGIFVLAGLSSFPVLTAAVVREMGRTMELVSVDGGIAPSPHAGIGLNVMRAVVGYAGSPVKLQRGGRPGRGTGLAESRRFTVAVPGKLPLRNVHFSLVDVPDLQVLPAEHPTLTDVWMGAGPVPEVLHRVLNGLAKARARFRLPSMVPLAPLFYTVLNLMKFGEHRGGMFVRAQGIRNGEPMELTWHLLAEGDDGPYIPSMAIEAVIRQLLAGERPADGARPATRALELDQYVALFAGRSIHTGFRREEAGAALYLQLLGSAFDVLPPQVQALHRGSEARRWSGRADVRRGTGLMARAIAAMIGFPKAGNDVPVTVQFTPENGGERWTREFGGRRFSSLQWRGQGRNAYLLMERFGVMDVAMALVVEGERLQLVARRWSLFGVPMPGFLLPRGTAFETETDGMFVFDVEIAAPFVGMIVGYRGRLMPE